MGLAIRGEPTAAEFNEAVKEGSLKVAAKIKVNGGPHNGLEKGFLEVAEAAGNTPQEIEAAADAQRPKIFPR